MSVFVHHNHSNNVNGTIIIISLYFFHCWRYTGSLTDNRLIYNKGYR